MIEPARAMPTTFVPRVLCPHCGYDVTLVKAGRCPECGLSQEELRAEKRWAARLRRSWMIAFVFASGSLAGAVLALIMMGAGQRPMRVFSAMLALTLVVWFLWAWMWKGVALGGGRLTIWLRALMVLAPWLWAASGVLWLASVLLSAAA